MRALDLTSDVIKAAAVVLEDCVREAVLDLVASCDTIVELEALIEAVSWMFIEDEDNFRDDFLRLEPSSEAFDKYLSCEDARACF